MNDLLYTCPCCGFKTLDEKPPGTFEICGMCGWEVDTVQTEDPDYEGGPNGICLREAQYEFLEDYKKNPDDMGYSKDSNWKILSPPSKETRLKNVKTHFVADDKGNIRKFDT